jgi:precorrin-6B methylase 2
MGVYAQEPLDGVGDSNGDITPTLLVASKRHQSTLRLSNLGHVHSFILTFGPSGLGGDPVDGSDTVECCLFRKRGKKDLTRAMTLLKNLLSQVWTECNESVLGIRTGPEGPIVSEQEPWRSQPSEKAKHSDNWRYATIGYQHARKILRVVKPGLDDVFYDIGCGMGRILCVAAQRPVRKCVGIELQEPLCRIARRNASRLRGRKAPIEIVCGDAATVDLSDGTIYFMFNPFGPETLRDTLENIKGSLSKNPRGIKIVYYHAKYRSVVEPLEWLVRVQEFERFGGHPVSIWENRCAEDGRVFRGSASWGRAQPGFLSSGEQVIQRIEPISRLDR